MGTTTDTRVDVSDLLGQSLDGIARITLRHERRQCFRWLFILEVAVFIGVMCCLIPLIVILTLVGGDLEFDLPEMRGRAYRKWQEISIELIDAEGRITDKIIEAPKSKREGHALVASILAAANRESRVVVQMIGRELANVWYGGQPMMAEPAVIGKIASQDLIEEEGGTVAWSKEELTIRFPGNPTSKIAALIGLFLLWPLLFWFRAGRQSIRNMWCDVRGVHPPYWQFRVRAETLSLSEHRGDHISFQERTRGIDLLGIAWCANLGFDREVTRQPPHLRWMCRDELIDLPFPTDPALGRAVRDLLVAGSIELRARHPELGFQASDEHPAHCPYCATLYAFGPNTQCPTCGAPCTGLAAKM